MRTSRVILGAVLVLAGCAYILARRDVLRFSHSRHFESEIGCPACHEGVEKSETGGRHLPAMDTCRECHEEEVVSKCSYCHSHPDHAKAIHPSITDLVFSHKAHMERTGDDCFTCHPAKKSSKSLDRLIPPMKTCETCHSEEIGRLDCTFCHKDLSMLAQPPRSFMVHRQGWQRDHAALARPQPDICARCHDRSHCASCHSRVEEITIYSRSPEGVARQYIHRGDWITLHGADARLDQASCLRCHGIKGCEECHKRMKVSPTGPQGIHRHPQGWLVQGSPDFHGRAARREIAACASCHDRGTQSNCVTCHRSRPGARSPHPPGWSSPLDRTRAPACSPCHNPPHQ